VLAELRSALGLAEFVSPALSLSIVIWPAKTADLVPARASRSHTP
jgi:hypothetical protein